MVEHSPQILAREEKATTTITVHKIHTANSVLTDGVLTAKVLSTAGTGDAHLQSWMSFKK